MMKRTFAVLFAVGGVAYVMIELLYRGYSHISMFFAGGLSAALIHLCCNVCRPFCRWCVWVKCAIGSAIITVIELCTGLIVNVGLGLDVWDYSALPFNFKGQICLRLSVCWFFLTIPALWICKFVCAKLEHARPLFGRRHGERA